MKIRHVRTGVVFALFMLLMTVSAVVASPAQQTIPLQLPDGFSDQTAVSGLLAPRDFTFLPDGRMLILERGNSVSQDFNFASVRVFKNGALLPTRALSLSTCGDSERGALGITIDPDFNNNGYVYIYYTRQAPSGSGSACGYNTYEKNLPGPRNRVSRFTMSGDVIDPNSEVIYIDNIVTEIGYHNAGKVLFGPDGYLYISTGDGGIATSAQNLALLNGKILRIKPDALDPRGYITTGNPYEGASGARTCGTTSPQGGTGPCREIYAYGLRNPFRFTIIPDMTFAGNVLYPPVQGQTWLAVGDVGGGAWEEVNFIAPPSGSTARNYGHPEREGFCANGVICNPATTSQPPGFIPPVYAYQHKALYANNDSAVIGAAFYTGDNYPVIYKNNFFFVDFTRSFIRRLVFDPVAGVWNAAATDFAPEPTSNAARGIIGLQSGPGNSIPGGWGTDLYYINFLSDNLRISEIRRIVYSAGIVPPVAFVSANILNPALSNTPNLTLSAAGSYDPDNNQPLTYIWDFGDGSPLRETTNVTTTYNYTSADNRTVTLIVRDSQGNESEPETITLYPGNQPATAEIQVTNLTDANRANFHAGDTWAFQAINVVDPDGYAGGVPGSAYEWNIPFHHRDHNHPFLSNLSGASGQFDIPVTGETDPVVWYRVILNLADERGQVTTIQRDINPVTTTVTLAANFSGLQLSFEGHSVNAPFTATRVVGMNIPIGAPDEQTISSGTFKFGTWSNGGAQSQTLVIPPSPLTLTASYGNVAPPRNRFSTATPTLTWTRIDGALNYQLDLDDNASFSSPLSIVLPATGLSWTVDTPLANNTAYFWRVRAQRSANPVQWGAWSQTETFQVVLP